jgi:hypothetical protein
MLAAIRRAPAEAKLPANPQNATRLMQGREKYSEEPGSAIAKPARIQ